MEVISIYNTCFQKRKGNTKSLAYTSLVHAILEHGDACWDPCTERQINALGQVQRKAAYFPNNTTDSVWETLVQRR
jgi:hypothetical protein